MGSRRAGIVEIDQHGRVAHRRQQEIVEAAGHMGTDRFALEGADKTHHGGPRDGDGEMVGPESDEAFPQGLAALNLGEDAGLRLLHISLVLEHDERAGRRGRGGLGHHEFRLGGSGIAGPDLGGTEGGGPELGGPAGKPG